MRNKSNQKILLLRPQAQAVNLVEKLTKEGLAADILPVMEIQPLDEVREEDAVGLQKIKSLVMDLDHYQKIIFVSQHAVEHAMRWIDQYWPQMPLGVEFYAIGQTTSESLRQYGVKVKSLGQTGEDMTSESLLQHPGLQSVRDEKIAICRGVGGRTHLGEQLSLRGAQVHYGEFYRRAIPANASAELAQWVEQNVIESNGLSWLLVFHSGESWQNFYGLITGLNQTLKVDVASKLKSFPILVPSRRVSELVEQAGFANRYLAKNATDEAVIEAIHQYFLE